VAVYVVLKRRREDGVALPNFESFIDLPEVDPEHKLLTIEDGECVDVAKFYLSQDKSYVIANQYRVSNIDNQLKEEIIESYTLSRNGK
jgi:hypothetical protein